MQAKTGDAKTVQEAYDEQVSRASHLKQYKGLVCHTPFHASCSQPDVDSYPLLKSTQVRPTIAMLGLA